MSPVNGSVAPTCPISRSQAVAGQPSAEQSIVPVTDLPSAIVALNQIALILQPPIRPVVVPSPTGNSSADQDGGGGKGKRAGWEELHRNIERVTIKNPDDHSMGVTLDRITFLLFRERKTQVTLKWEL